MSTDQKLYALSDLHLQADHNRYLFTDAKQRVFVRVANEALAQGATLLLAGDVFDLTGMTPPRAGLDAFFSAQGLAVPKLPTAMEVGPAMQALRARFPDFFTALEELANEDRLWIIPGNHDYAVGSATGQAAFATALGVPVNRLQFMSTARVGQFLFAEHGNAYDPSNATTNGWQNSGSVITSALYHAVAPALRALGVDDQVADAVSCVRPEENIVGGLVERLGPASTKKLLLALVELLRVNGYFSRCQRVAMWVATRWLKCMVTPDRVRRRLADDSKLADAIRNIGVDIASGERATEPPGAQPTIAVMGHTHVLDTTEKWYVNLGTWIDHVTGLTEEQLNKPDLTLPVLVVDGHAAALYDCQNMTSSVTDANPLWTSP
jgi:UDP-2,3-diacylglucosamine pyrophosphatase LpxH